MPTTVRLIDSRDIRPVDVRPRPAGYLVLRAGADVAERLGLNQVKVREVATGSPDGRRGLPCHLDRKPQAARGDQSRPVGAGEIEKKTMDVPAGTLFVPMDQPAAGVAAAALEPDYPAAMSVSA